MNYCKRFVVEPGAKVKLHKIDPGFIDPDQTEKNALAETTNESRPFRILHYLCSRADPPTCIHVPSVYSNTLSSILTRSLMQPISDTVA